MWKQGGALKINNTGGDCNEKSNRTGFGNVPAM